MKKLNHILHWDEFYKYGVALFLFVFGLQFVWSFLALACYLWFVRRQMNLLFCVCLFLILWLSYSLLISFDATDIHGEVKVIQIDEFGNYNRYKVKYKRYKFYFNHQPDKYQLGDVLFVKATIKPYREQSVPFGFNSKTYYLSFHIYGKLELQEIEKVNHKFNIYEARDGFKKRIQDLDSSDYVQSFIFGEKIKNSETTSIYENFNILYLFTISGLHVYILMSVFKKVLFLLNLNTKFQHVMIILLYLCIGYLSRFSFAVLRLLIMYIIKLINDAYEINMEKMDRLFLTFFILLISHMGYIYHQGFLMTFIILFGLELIHPFTQSYRPIVQKIMMSLVITLLIIPFYNDIYFLQILTLPFIIICVVLILYPFAVLTFISPIIDDAYKFIIGSFERCILFLSKHQLHIYIPKFNTLMSIIFYTLFIWFFFSKNLNQLIKRALLWVLVIVLASIIRIEDKRDSITFLDVGQGDSTVVNTKQCRIVIDAFEGATNYLKNQGVYEIDYLILTHSHQDHIKEAKEIMDTLKVKQLVVSYYDKKYPFYQQKPLRLKANDKIKCGNLNLDFLGPLKSYENENNVSLVFKFIFDSKIFLFTGDIEEQAEFDLIRTYGKQLKADILKVAHHGSITSSTQDFLKHTNPKYAIMSLALNNKYEFPSNQVITRFQKMTCIIYRTDVHGTITYDAKKRKEKWHLYLSI